MRLLCSLTCLSLTFLVALHGISLSSGCSPMLGISLICCAVLAEHVSSNASDSESSYRKCFKLFVLLLSPVIYPVGVFPLVMYSEN